MKKFIGTLILCLTHLGAATYYLDAANGLDTNPGTSAEPWQTLARAMINSGSSPRAAYGDTVLLKNGDYGRFNLPNSALTEYTGSLSDSLPAGQEYIVYKAAAGQTRVTMSSIVFNLGTRMYIVAHEFDGISITDASWHTVHIEGSMGVRIKNLALQGITDADTLYAHKTVYSMVVIDKPSSDITVSGCEITGGYDGIAVLGYNCNIKILNNRIHHVGVDKIKCGGGINMLIEGNEIYGNSYLTSEHPDCIQFYTAANRYGVSARWTNLTIRNNCIRDHSSQGLWTGGSYLENVVFENNLMYNLGNYEWRVYNVHKGIIRNNTIIANKIGNTGIIIYGGIYGDSGDSNGELDSLPRNSDITLVNNIFALPYTGSEDVITYHDYNVFVPGWSGSLGRNEPHSREFATDDDAKAALFKDPAAHDYRLKAGCVAIDFGTTAQGVHPTDHNGYGRDAVPDAGCFEYGSQVTGLVMPGDHLREYRFLNRSMVYSILGKPVGQINGTCTGMYIVIPEAGKVGKRVSIRP